MKKIIACLLVAALSLFCLTAYADEEDSLTKLSASATAAVSVTADRARVSLGCETVRDTVSEALSVNNTALNSILTALSALGLSDGDIVTDNFRIDANYEHVYDKNGNGKNVLKGYQASHTLNVTVKDITLLGTVIDAAVKAGANQTYGIEFYCSTEGAAYDQALAQAVKDARAKLELMASAAGMTLQRVTDISQNSDSYNVYRNNYMAKDAVSEAAGTVIASGQMSVSATVSMEGLAK